MTKQPSKNWRRMEPIYRYFGEGNDNLDFNEASAVESYLFETHGTGNLKQGVFAPGQSRFNGFAIGKHWMDVTIKMWLQDLQDGILRLEELYEEFPQWHWWLDKMVKKPLQRKSNEAKADRGHHPDSEV